MHFEFPRFFAPKKGQSAVAMEYYERALDIDPNYVLARSYMGQGMVADGNIAGAKEQLEEIRDLGHSGSWAYTMLEDAIQKKGTY